MTWSSVDVSRRERESKNFGMLDDDVIAPTWRIRHLLLLLTLTLRDGLALPSIPNVIVDFQLEGAHLWHEPRVRRDNGVVASRDGGSVWVTTTDGSVRIIHLQPNHNVFEMAFYPSEFTGRSIECKSSIALYEEGNLLLYGVYAVIDKPASSDESITRYANPLTIFNDEN